MFTDHSLRIFSGFQARKTPNTVYRTVFFNLNEIGESYGKAK